jgi:DHA2 family multidrug resistance protein
MASTHWLNPFNAAGLTAIDGMITKQATIISFMDDFKLMMIMSLAAMPLVLLLRSSAKPPEMDHSAVME